MAIRLPGDAMLSGTQQKTAPRTKWRPLCRGVLSEPAHGHHAGHGQADKRHTENNYD
jgi:hypothetical protein